MGIPRSVTSRKGVLSLPSRPPLLTADSGSCASTTWYPPWPRRARPGTCRTSSSSSTSRIVRAGSRPRAGAPGAPVAAAGARAGRDTTGTWIVDVDGSLCGCMCRRSLRRLAASAVSTGAATAGRPRGGVSADSARARSGSEGGPAVVATSATTSSSGAGSGSANEASTAAEESRRSSSMPRARSRSSSWGLMPDVEGLGPDVARTHASRRLLGQAEAELPLPQADELLQGHLDAGADDGRRASRPAARRSAGRAARSPR